MMEMIINQIIEFENNFDGYLINAYQDKNEFKKDLEDQITQYGTTELLDYYTSDCISRNNTNSTEYRREKQKELILTLNDMKYIHRIKGGL